jgi:hypothetical protein
MPEERRHTMTAIDTLRLVVDNGPVLSRQPNTRRRAQPVPSRRRRDALWTSPVADKLKWLVDHHPAAAEEVDKLLDELRKLLR